MGSTIHHDQSGIWVVNVFGALRKEELDAVQAAGLKGMDPRENAKVLIVVEDDFCGWIGTETYGNTSMPLMFDE